MFVYVRAKSIKVKRKKNEQRMYETSAIKRVKEDKDRTTDRVYFVRSCSLSYNSYTTTQGNYYVRDVDTKLCMPLELSA